MKRVKTAWVFWRRSLIIAFAVLALVLAQPMTAYADYQYYESDYPKTSTDNGNVYVYQWPNGEARAELRWYNDVTWRGTYMQGVFFNTYIMGTGRGGGCIFAKVTWTLLDPSISFPIGASVGTKNVSNGWYSSCRPNANSPIPWIKLGGNHWSQGERGYGWEMQKATLTICQGFSVNGPKINCKSDSFWYGYN